MNSFVKMFYTCLLFVKLLIVTHMIAQIPTLQIFHHQVEILTILELRGGVYDEGAA